MSTPERLTRSPETSTEDLGDAAAERSKELRKKLEDKLEGKEKQEHHIEAERKKIESIFSKEHGSEKKQHSLDSESPKRPAGKKQRQASYKQTMKRVQADMPPVQRAFSKFIHNPIAEKASDIIGSTVARPNAILAGSFSALVFVSVAYILANTMGFRLSGFETIGAFILGWIVGIGYDFLKTMITGKR
jgi:hypothetical protein